MLLSSSEMFSLLYASAIWFLPRLLLLVFIYVVVRAAVRAELKRSAQGDNSDSNSAPNSRL